MSQPDPENKVYARGKLTVGQDLRDIEAAIQSGKQALDDFCPCGDPQFHHDESEVVIGAAIASGHLRMNHAWLWQVGQAVRYYEEAEELRAEVERLREVLVEASSWITDRKEQARILALLSNDKEQS